MEWSAPQDEADLEVLDCGVFPRLPSFRDIFASSFDDVLVPLDGLSYDPQERKTPVPLDDSCGDNNTIPDFSALIFCLLPLETPPAITPYNETPPRHLPTLLPLPPKAPALASKETQKEGRQEELHTQGSNAVVGNEAATGCSCEGCTKQEKAASQSEAVPQEVDSQCWASAKADGVRDDIQDAGGLIDGAVGMLDSSIGSFRNFCPAARQRQRKIVLCEDVRNW